ncbi:ETC complex I subunit [Aurantiacibacter gangjinensis]|uniref:ETC complex subunit I n=1 Tax=Aurantiacibacter gangjinensis TaxID=502682 RepID=A0A0G9MR10_9SPHN|nr:ETC complex I subunit [Aurantiacibacter gangjinensis]APE29050.1 NADH-ubiquinone oxidoreductase-related protein [Aurantiacibacter gangjinensis]KLE33142.1 ETC complex subunit I [Aurantiacibacter gangjinensis]
MTEARIFKRPQSAMQSGKARTDEWVLQFVPAEREQHDPLMGWTGSGDTRQQVQLTFESCDAAQDYAKKHGIAARIHQPPVKKLKIQAYADNFR